MPAAGRAGAAPACPYRLARAGRAWWRWAWSTPQATKWDAGAVYFVARRALLEDHMAALGFADEFDARDLFEDGDFEAAKRIEWALRLLKRNASGEVALMKEMRELEDRLGLTPKAMAALRWTIDTGEGPVGKPPRAGATVRRLHAVDPKAS